MQIGPLHERQLKRVLGGKQGLEGKSNRFQLITQQTRTIAPNMSFQRGSTCALVCTQRELDWDWCRKSGSFERMEHTEETPRINQSMSSGDGGNGKGKERRVWGEEKGGEGKLASTPQSFEGFQLRTLCSDKEPLKVCKQIGSFSSRTSSSSFSVFNSDIAPARCSPRSRVARLSTCLLRWNVQPCLRHNLRMFSQQNSKNKAKRKKQCLSNSFWFAPTFWDGSKSHPAESEFSRRCELARTHSFFLSSLPWYTISF